MKPKIDLQHPIISLGIKYYQEQVVAALNAPQTIESAIIPIYAIPKSKAHNSKKTKPEQIASGVLVNIQDQYFIFSATHVFKAFWQNSLLTGVGNGTLIEQLSGERFSSGKPEAPGEDAYDASVYHIQSHISDSLKKLAITLLDFDVDGYDPVNPIYMMSGFRSKKSNTAGTSIKSKRECFASVEFMADDYTKFGFSRKTHLILAYEDQALMDNKWVSTPIPVGMSGGAIMKAEGTSANFFTASKRSSPKQLLSAIITDHRRGKKGHDGMLIGTRVNIHLGLIDQHLPDILNEFKISKGILPD
jgi:hypothetical protein